jgi:hypothetical protein
VRRFSWCSALGLSLVGCYADDPTAYDRSRLAVCDSVCDGYVRCGLTPRSCESLCAAGYHPRGVRASVLASVAECLKHQPCAAIVNDSAFTPCVEQAAEQEPLRTEVIAYCESASLSHFRCDNWWSVEQCAHASALWTDETLAAAKDCHERDCEELVTCEGAVFADPP